MIAGTLMGTAVCMAGVHEALPGLKSFAGLGVIFFLVHSSSVLSQPWETVPKIFDNARMSYLVLAAEATQQADVA